MIRRRLIVCLVGPLVAIACHRGPTEAELRESARIEAVRDTIRLQRDSLSNGPHYPRDSMLGALQQTRLQQLQLTDDLLRHRAEALKAGADFHYEAPAFPPDIPRADSLARIISAERDSLRTAQQWIARTNAGGLLGAFAQLEVQTRRMTIEMLEMSRLSALYGIGLPPVLSGRGGAGRGT